MFLSMLLLFHYAVVVLKKRRNASVPAEIFRHELPASVPMQCCDPLSVSMENG